MSPEERQLLADLFDRTRAAAGQARDRDAEALIADSVRAQPHAPYLLAQTVLVQEQALRAAADRLQQLEAQVQDLTARAEQQPPAAGGFLGGLGSLFGGAQAPQPAPRPAPAPFGRPQGAPGNPWGGAPQAPQGGFGQQPGPQNAQQNAQQNPWGGAQQQPAGGGFLKGALGTAAGVAGGVLLANSLSSLFHGGNNPLGIGAGHQASNPSAGNVSNESGGAYQNASDNYGNDGYGNDGDDSYISDADFSGDDSDDDDGFDA